MGAFLTSALVATLSVASLVQAAPPNAKTDKQPSAKQSSADGPHLARDLATLKAFAQTITSDPQGIKQNWTAAGNDVCSFAGIVCAQHPDGYNAVAGIDFNDFHLGANLRLEGLLDKLTDLAFFHANSNNFVGTVPDLRELKYLYELDLSNNGLTGGFPLNVLSAPLTFLDLRVNRLQGELPAALFTQTDMDVIFLNNNSFTGRLPDAGSISTLYITLANNKFTGQIPASFANIKHLREIRFGNDQFTGTVPEELCALVNLTVLDVSGNAGLTGQLGPKCAKLLSSEVFLANATSLTVQT